MNEKLLLTKETITKYWTERTNSQKAMIIGSSLLFFILLVFVSTLGVRVNMVPLYTNLSFQETGEIKAQLDARGITSEITNSGTAINVPSDLVDSLKVELAAEGIPKSGSIDYSTFKDRMGFGMTDNEFSIMERAAIQTELANLIRSIDGIEHAQVMITLPEENIWISSGDQSASAAVSLKLRPGYQLNQTQIRALYHLISKSVPKLPLENIVIMNQMFEHLELNNQNLIDSTLSVFEQQRSIQKEIERDLQRQIQQMLGTLVGRDKVIVSVTTDIDFTKEKREEDLVTPVDEMSGLAISIERITETFSGEDFGGIPGTGETDIPGYPAGATAGSGNYERMEERINNEVNRIRREIVLSPYQVRDIGIQVMVEPPNPEDPLSVELLNDIKQILNTIVRTSISKELIEQLTPEQINEKIFVSSKTFDGKTVFVEVDDHRANWYYVVIALLLFIVILIILLLRKNKKIVVKEEIKAPTFNIPNINEERDSEEKARRRQLEKMAKEKPEEFSILVRTWMAEDEE